MRRFLLASPMFQRLPEIVFFDSGFAGYTSISVSIFLRQAALIKILFEREIQAYHRKGSG